MNKFQYDTQGKEPSGGGGRTTKAFARTEASRKRKRVCYKWRVQFYWHLMDGTGEVTLTSVSELGARQKFARSMTGYKIALIYSIGKA